MTAQTQTTTDHKLPPKSPVTRKQLIGKQIVKPKSQLVNNTVGHILDSIPEFVIQRVAQIRKPIRNKLDKT